MGDHPRSRPATRSGVPDGSHAPRGRVLRGHLQADSIQPGQVRKGSRRAGSDDRHRSDLRSLSTRFFRLARPLANSPPTSLCTKPLQPVIAHVTLVTAPALATENTAVLVATNGRRNSRRMTTLRGACDSTTVMR